MLKFLKAKNCYYCEHCIVQDTLFDFLCEISGHLVIRDFEETEYFYECKGKEFARE